MDLAEVCSTAVKKPVGKVKAASQNSVGGFKVLAQVEKCSIRRTKSRDQEAKGFSD